MAEKNNATCSICGKGYHMCLSCKDDMNMHPWKMHTDTSEHYKVYQVIHGYSTGVYTKSEADAKLQMVDLTDFDTFRESVKEVIEVIRRESKSVVRPAAKQHGTDDKIGDTPNVPEVAHKTSGEQRKSR